LKRCLDGLATAREHVDFTVLVSDSSDDEIAPETRSVVGAYRFATLVPHTRSGAAGARNVGTEASTSELIVVVDDDVYVDPLAVRRLIEAYERGNGWRVIAGSVAWGEMRSCPAVMRPIGYARPPRNGESPSFLISAFLLYPRALAIALPWNEQLRSSEDRFMGALWRSKGVHMLFAPEARAVHDEEHNAYGVDHQECHIYTNLYDALLANPSVTRAVSYEVLGFLAAARLYLRSRRTAGAFLRAWHLGHIRLASDWRHLKRLTETPLPPFPEQ
jgi:glycosyltransferase involved in cell wall biosynthesis